MKKDRIHLVVLLIIGVWLAGGNVISIPLMAMYNLYQQALWRPSLDVDMPGGWTTLEKDWFPLVLTHTELDMTPVMGIPSKMQVQYAFGAFNGFHSQFYDEGQKYYHSFYGCYIIEAKEERRLQRSDHSWDQPLLQKILQFDLDVLVLSSLGCDKGDSTFEITHQTDGVELCGWEGWTRFDALITTRSPDHVMERFLPAYIQYGFPPGNVSENFPPVKGRGLLYARYFPDAKEYLMFYVLTKDISTLEETDAVFIQGSRVEAAKNGRRP